MDNIVDTYEIATMGQNLSNTFTLASNGILIDIQIEDLAPVIPVRKGASPTGVDYKEDEEIQRKKITVTVTLDGKKYTESVIVEDKPELKVEDVNVEVTPTQEKPKITISFDI